MKKILVISTALALAACGGNDPKSEMKQAINNASHLNKVCVPYELQVEQLAPETTPLQSLMGADEIKIMKRNSEGKRTNEDAQKQMDNLARAGLYKEEKEQKSNENKQVIAVYRLTERGAENISRAGHNGVLCVGSHQAESINYFTEPTAARGFTVSQVSYEAKIVPEKWAKSLLKDDKNHKAILEQKNTRFATLVKTNDGWRDIRELGQ